MRWQCGVRDYAYVVDGVLVYCDPECQACEEQLATGPGGSGGGWFAVEGETGQLVPVPDRCGWEAIELPEPGGAGMLLAILVGFAILALWGRRRKET